MIRTQNSPKVPFLSVPVAFCGSLFVAVGHAHAVELEGFGEPSCHFGGYGGDKICAMTAVLSACVFDTMLK